MRSKQKITQAVPILRVFFGIHSVLSFSEMKIIVFINNFDAQFESPIHLKFHHINQICLCMKVQQLVLSLNWS